MIGYFLKMNKILLVISLTYLYFVTGYVSQTSYELDYKVNIKNSDTVRENRIQGIYGFDDDDDEEDFDTDDYIERPCPVYDRFCIRGFFSQHSKCKIASGPVPDPFYLAQSQAYASRVNLTVVTIDNSLTGLNTGRIEEFYINRKTNRLVLAVYFPKVNAKVGQANFNFFRNGAEPILRIAPADQFYDGLVATYVFPSINDLKLQESEITAYLENGLSPFVVGPGVVNDTDPVVIASFAALLEDIPTSLRELLLAIIPQFGSIWIQYNICDFGVPINRIGFINDY